MTKVIRLFKTIGLGKCYKEPKAGKSPLTKLLSKSKHKHQEDPLFIKINGQVYEVTNMQDGQMVSIHVKDLEDQSYNVEPVLKWVKPDYWSDSYASTKRI